MDFKQRIYEFRELNPHVSISEMSKILKISIDKCVLYWLLLGKIEGNIIQETKEMNN